MKTLKKNNEIKRVKDSSPSDEAQIQSLLNSGWKYCPKSEWKATRPVKEKVDKKKVDKKENKKRGIDS